MAKRNGTRPARPAAGKAPAKGDRRVERLEQVVRLLADQVKRTAEVEQLLTADDAAPA